MCAPMNVCLLTMLQTVQKHEVNVKKQYIFGFAEHCSAVLGTVQTKE